MQLEFINPKKSGNIKQPIAILYQIVLKQIKCSMENKDPTSNEN